MTDNQDYTTPTIGQETGWGAELNANFEDLDTDVEIRDTDANKGNYTPKDGAMYRATDTGAIYIGNGTSWVLADLEADSIKSNSVETDDAKLTTDFSSIGTSALSGQTFASGDDSWSVRGYHTLVGTSATGIARTPTYSANRHSALVLVTGFSDSNGNVTFTDRVVFSEGGSDVSVLSAVERQSPDARSYSTSNNTATLQLAMSANLYRIGTLTMTISAADK